MNQKEPETTAFTPFWPVFLLTLSLALYLGWQTAMAAQQHVTTLRLLDQQALVEGQAAQAEGRLQALMMDLLLLARTEPEAQAIAAKYRIVYTPPQPAPAAPAPPAPLGPDDGAGPRP